MMITRISLFIFAILTLFSQPLFSQEGIIKTFADTSALKDYCFYPSTLRMLNLAESQDYYDMVEDIDKLLIYSLDSSAVADKSYLEMMKEYQNNRFEEFAVMVGGKTNFYIYGKEGEKTEFVGAFKESDNVYTFYLIGNIGWQKIPSLIQSISQGEMFNLFDLNLSNGR